MRARRGKETLPVWRQVRDGDIKRELVRNYHAMVDAGEVLNFVHIYFSAGVKNMTPLGEFGPGVPAYTTCN